MASLSSKVVLAASNAARRMGQALDSIGASMEVARYTERLVPSTRFVAVDGVAPTLADSVAFVAPTASVIGDVTIGPNSSIWYGATVRGDVNVVTIGSNSSIGDRAVVHVAKIQGDLPTIIGDDVVVGPGAIVHAATLGHSCVVGAAAQVLDGSVVETNAVVAPGSVVTPGTTVPTGQLWAGSPAKMMRELSQEEIKSIAEMARDNVELAILHAVECSKDYHQVAKDEEDYEDVHERDPDYMPRDTPNENDVLGQGPPGQIFNTTLSHPELAAKNEKK